MSILEGFIIGFIGALAPEIVRLYTLRSRPPKGFSGFYFLISGLFAALGGIVAIALPATTFWAALYAGISTPAVINTALKKTTRSSASGLRYAAAQRQDATRPSFSQFLSGL